MTKSYQDVRVGTR